MRRADGSSGATRGNAAISFAMAGDGVSSAATAAVVGAASASSTAMNVNVGFILEQPQALEAGMLAAAQYYMILQAQPHRGDRLRHLAGSSRCRLATACCRLRDGCAPSRFVDSLSYADTS